MNKQPFYHCATILFTSTNGMSAQEFEKVLGKIKDRHIVEGSMQLESYEEPEAGDPADLV